MMMMMMTASGVGVLVVVYCCCCCYLSSSPTRRRRRRKDVVVNASMVATDFKMHTPRTPTNSAEADDVVVDDVVGVVAVVDDVAEQCSG